MGIIGMVEARDAMDGPGRVAVVLLAVAPVLLAGVLGNLATMPNLAPWYTGLAKPPFNPPNWVFGPAWGLLYLMMAVAFGRILRLPRRRPGRGRAIAWFLVQITLNALWSFAFFAARSPAAGLVVITLLLVSIALTLRQFAVLDRAAGWLLVPYICWVAFAAVLDGAIWHLNP